MLLPVKRWLPDSLTAAAPWQIQVNAQCSSEAAEKQHDLPNRILTPDCTLPDTLVLPGNMTAQIFKKADLSLNTPKTENAGETIETGEFGAPTQFVFTANVKNRQQAQHALKQVSRYITQWNLHQKRLRQPDSIHPQIAKTESLFNKTRASDVTFGTLPALPEQITVKNVIQATVKPAYKAPAKHIKPLPDANTPNGFKLESRVLKLEKKIAPLQSPITEAEAATATLTTTRPQQPPIGAPIMATNPGQTAIYATSIQRLPLRPYAQRLSVLESRLNTLNGHLQSAILQQNKAQQTLLAKLNHTQAAGTPQLKIVTRASHPILPEDAQGVGVLPGLGALAAASLLMALKPAKKADKISKNTPIFAFKPRRHLIGPDDLTLLTQWLRPIARKAPNRQLLLIGLNVDELATPDARENTTKNRIDRFKAATTTMRQPRQTKRYATALLTRQAGMALAEQGLSTLLIDGPGCDIDDSAVKSTPAGDSLPDRSYYAGLPQLQLLNRPAAVANASDKNRFAQAPEGIPNFSERTSENTGWPNAPWPTGYAYTLAAAEAEALALENLPINHTKTASVKSAQTGAAAWPLEDVILVSSRKSSGRGVEPLPVKTQQALILWAQQQGLLVQGIIDIQLS